MSSRGGMAPAHYFTGDGGIVPRDRGRMGGVLKAPG